MHTLPILGARAHDYPGATPDALFQNIAGDGFGAIQLAFPKSFGVKYPIPEDFTEETKIALDKHRIHLAVVGCYINPALPDKADRLAQVDTFISAMPVAKALGAGCVGTETTHILNAGGEQKKAMAQLIDSLKRMAEAAEKYGVNMGIEPVYGHVMCGIEETQECIHQVGSDRFKIIWDAVNLMSPERAKIQPEYFARCYEAFRERLVAMHLKDFHADSEWRKPSAPLFEGDLDAKALLTLVKNEGGLPILREEALPERSKGEIAAIYKIWEK